MCRPTRSRRVPAMITRLDHYRLLCRSGLRVSPFALGTMTFGVKQGWGTDAAEARRIFDGYAEHGGNSIDNANFYASGESERMLGELLQGRRNRFVVATKYSLSMRPRSEARRAGKECVRTCRSRR